MSDTVTIVPASCQSAAQTAYYRALIRSHKSSCDSDLLFIFNNLHEKAHRDLAEQFTKELSDLNYKWLYYGEEYNLTKIWNYGKRKTESEYMVFCIADTMFLGDWLTPLKLLVDTRKYHCAQGVSRQDYSGVWSYYDKGVDLYETTQPIGYHYVMRRDNGFWFDEEVGIYCPDQYYWEYLRETNQLAAVHRHSHVEHLSAPISFLNTHHSSTWEGRAERELKIVEAHRAENWKTKREQWLKELKENDKTK